MGKSWGILGNPTKEQIQEWSDMPYGEFHKMVIQLEKDHKRGNIGDYEMCISRVTTTRDEYRFTIKNSSIGSANKMLGTLKSKLEEGSLDLEFNNVYTNEVKYYTTEPKKIG